MRRGALAIALLGSISAVGCASSIEVVRTVSPEEARKISSPEVTISAVFREHARLVVPDGAKIEVKEDALRIVWTNAETFVYVLKDGDAIQEDEQQRITGVAMANGSEIHFVPGTATSPAGSREVRGKLDADAKQSAIDLTTHDLVEMRGMFAPGDKVPFGGHVESTRSNGAFVGGGLLLALSYVPTAYVGATSSRNGDRALLAPIVGPWIDLATRAKCVPPAGSQNLPVDPCVEEKAIHTALVVSGGAEALGTVIFLFGLPSRAIYSADEKKTAEAKPSLVVVPTGLGAAAIGRF